MPTNHELTEEYFSFLANKEYPCVAAKAALSKEHIRVFVADHMACPKDDMAIMQFMYSFVDEYRHTDSFFHTAAIIFKGPDVVDEGIFDQLLWQRLQSLANIGAKDYGYDKRVSSNPASKDFSFSIKEEAFYIIGLHPKSNRAARRFKYPALVFNPHAQFDLLRQTNRYEKMKNIVRQRDIVYSGSVNPMLKDFGQSSEVFQYSGRKYEPSWQCPLKINNTLPNEYNTST